MGALISKLAEDASRDVLKLKRADQAMIKVLILSGPGESLASLRSKVEKILAASKSVELTRSQETKIPPLADDSVSSGHVNAVKWGFTPYPDVVLQLSETDELLTAAARLPGADPLAPSGDWLWVLSRKKVSEALSRNSFISDLTRDAGREILKLKRAHQPKIKIFIFEFDPKEWGGLLHSNIEKFLLDSGEVEISRQTASYLPPLDPNGEGRKMVSRAIIHHYIPFPDVVVQISETDALLVAAARQPGPNPFKVYPTDSPEKLLWSLSRKKPQP